MKLDNSVDGVRAIRWVEDGLELLDQRKLPDRVTYDFITRVEDVAEAIRLMKVRGAPAIGITASYGIVLAARARYAANPRIWKSNIETDLSLLANSRPTAVNLFWAIDSMREIIQSINDDPVPKLLEFALKIHENDIIANHRMGETGAELVSYAGGILTHCNTGSLATGGYGTALGVVRSAYKRGLKKIYASETRPWLQGTRLTLWELQQDGIPATLIADSAAASLMRGKAIEWVIVGADRITANGDVANKIGTYALAILAKQHRVKFMVVAPTSSIDWSTESGDGIAIEHRDIRELLMDYYIGPGTGIDAWNPAFDVTPGEFIDAIVTEKGTVVNPGAKSMKQLK